MMMIIIATNVINNDLVIMIVLITIIIWPFLVDWTHHVKDYFSLQASDEMRVLPVPGSTSCHQKNMNFSRSAIAGWDFCQDGLGVCVFRKSPWKSCLSPPTGKESLPTIIFSCELLNFGGCRSFRRLCTHLLNFLFDDASFVCVMSNVLWSLYWDRM